MEQYTPPFSCVDNSALADALADREDDYVYADYWVQQISSMSVNCADTDDVELEERIHLMYSNVTE